MSPGFRCADNVTWCAALRRPRTPTRGARSSSPFPQPKCICLLTYKRPFCYITQIETGTHARGRPWPCPLAAAALRLPCACTSRRVSAASSLHVAPPAPRRLRVQQLRRAAARRRKRESRGAQKSRSCKYLLYGLLLPLRLEQAASLRAPGRTQGHTAQPARRRSGCTCVIRVRKKEARGGKTCADQARCPRQPGFCAPQHGQYLVPATCRRGREAGWDVG